MRVDRLTLQSFRGFREQAFEFDPRLTVLVGVNGAGKTTILHALAIALSQVHAAVRTSTSHGRRFNDGDVRNGASHLVVSVAASVLDAPAEWSLAYVRPGHPRDVTSNMSALKEPADRVQRAIAADEDIELPLAALYPVNRAVLDIPERIRTRHKFDRLAAYDQALEGSGANFRLFFEWFREREDLENEQRSRRRSQPALFVEAQLEAVRHAITRLMPGFQDLHVERSPHRMIVSKSGEPFAIDQLSDGEKCLLALAGDLARRLVLANPRAAAPLDRPAVILIDEVELHLHPGWQRTVLPRLLETFPRCQFVVTTHSPQVLSSVDGRQVRLLDHFSVAEGLPWTRGRDSNAILLEVMKVAERPEKERAQIQAIAAAIDDERFEDARRALDVLAQTVTERDAEVVRLRSLLRFLEGEPDAAHQEGG